MTELKSCEEQLPSLKGKSQSIKEVLNKGVMDRLLYDKTNELDIEKIESDCFTLKDVQEHCLDKQKVKMHYIHLKSKFLEGELSEFDFDLMNEELKLEDKKND